MIEVFLHDDYVNVDVAKIDNKLSLDSTVINALKLLHEQGLIPVLIIISLNFNRIFYVEISLFFFEDRCIDTEGTINDNTKFIETLSYNKHLWPTK